MPLKSGSSRKIIPKGSLFYVSTGQYSDFHIIGVFRALADIDVDSLQEDWLEKHPEQRERYSFEEKDFFASLVVGKMGLKDEQRWK